MKYTLVITLIFFTIIVYGQAPSIEWQNTIGGSDNDYLHSLQLIEIYIPLLSGQYFCNRSTIHETG